MPQTESASGKVPERRAFINEDLFAARLSPLSKPFIQGMMYGFDKSDERFPKLPTLIALAASPDYASLNLSCALIYTQVGGVQLILELAESGLRKLVPGPNKD